MTEEKKVKYDSYEPIAIGGVGGSGTRLITEIMIQLGFDMGEDLNISNDNLWFTLLFKRSDILLTSDEDFQILLNVFLNGMRNNREFSDREIAFINNLAADDRSQHSAEWLKERAKTLLSRRNNEHSKYWGWKEPNTHIILDRLKKYLPAMRYIHVIRNGLDMAHSPNQNQLNLWGASFIGSKFDITPYFSLKYWCRVHRRILEIAQAMNSQFYLLNFDKLCLEPENSLRDFLEFLHLDIPQSQIDEISKIVRIPETLGRFKKSGLKIFDPEDVSYAKKLGFDTNI
ncbi:MAG: sulfotransferase [Candidatus Cloacimonetes bacterium]|nr:sulfotransferase [Candidatus Cloacimonadota bacterium]